MVQLRQDKSLHQISQRQLIAKGSNKGKAKKYGGGGEDESVSLFLFRTHTHTHMGTDTVNKLSGSWLSGLNCVAA